MSWIIVYAVIFSVFGGLIAFIGSTAAIYFWIKWVLASPTFWVIVMIYVFYLWASYVWRKD